MLKRICAIKGKKDNGIGFNSEWLFRDSILYSFKCGVCTSIWMSVYHIYAGAHGGQKNMLEPWELEVQEVVRCLILLLWTEVMSSETAASS